MTAPPSSSPPSEPAPKRRRSPWFYAAIGCSLMFVLTVGGCIAGITILGNHFYSEVNKPLEPNQVLADLGEIPIYQPSELDIEMTRVMRASMTFVPMGKPTAAAFRTSEPVEKIQQWYRQQLLDLGYQPAQNAENPLGDTEGLGAQLQFAKENQFVLIQG